MRYLSGSEVTEVFAYGVALSDADYKQFNDVDTAIVMMKFENGALGVIDNSRAAQYGMINALKFSVIRAVSRFPMN